MRYSNISKMLAQTRYIKDHKKPVTASLVSKPPKYVYQTGYHEKARPGMDLGFPDHHHPNLFLQQAGNRHENFRYSYTGQWWQGNSIFKMIMMAAPFLLYLGIIYAKDHRKPKTPSLEGCLHIDSLPHNCGLIPRAF